MYCEFYGFSEKPFTITPNPRFIFLSNNHREAFARLVYGVATHAGFIAMTGEVGTGKTTLLRALLSQLDEQKYCSGLVFNSCLSGDQLLAAICDEFRVESAEQNNYARLDALNRFLLEQHTAGRTVVLVIDEAQNLAPDALEQLRMISNLETERDKLIQIILAGQPELNDILGRHDLRQLNQRITVRCGLTPMGLSDTDDYIQHRLKTAGCRIPGFFPRDTVKKIYRFSRGVPRLINVVCEQALVMAWTRESLTVNSSIVSQVLAALRPNQGRRGWFRRIVARLSSGKVA